MPEVLPPEPTSWSLVEQITSSKTFVVPETGWFKFVLVAKSGDGGNSGYISNGSYSSAASGGSGGSGGICVSKHGISKGKSISIVFQNGNISILPLDLQVTAGANGSNGIAYNVSNADAGKGGSSGRASGGNILNQSGRIGNNGAVDKGYNSSDSISAFGGAPVSTTADGETTKSGGGGSVTKTEWEDDLKQLSGGSGTSAYLKIYRGNTNIPLDVQNARDITTNALAITALAQEQTGILLSTLA